MVDLLIVLREAATCPCCKRQFGHKVKFIPDCGKLICGGCFETLAYHLEDSRRFECPACERYHTMPENGLWDFNLFPDLQNVQIEKPLTQQAKELKLLVASLEKELSKLKAFNSKEHIRQHCEQLEQEVGEAAQSAVEHINEIESGLLKQISEYRQRCLDALDVETEDYQNEAEQASPISKIKRELEEEVNEFNAKWNDFFEKLSVLSTDKELEDALVQAGSYQVRIQELEREMRNNALNGALMQFDANQSFLSEVNYLGKLAEISTEARYEIKIQETTSKTLTGHSDWIGQVLFLPDGRLASSSDDNTVKVWDTASGKELFTLRGHTLSVYSMVMLPNGWLVSGSGDRKIKLWDLESRREVRALEGHTHSVVSLKVLKSGHLVSYSNDNTMKIWNVYQNENNLLSTINGHGNVAWLAPLFGLLSSRVPSNDLLITCSRDRDDQEVSTLRVWDPKDGRLVNSFSTGLIKVRAVFVLSNDRVAVGTDDGNIKIIDLDDDQKSNKKEKAHNEWIFCLLQLPNSNLVSSGLDKDGESSIHSIKVWNMSDLSILQHVKTDHSDKIFSLSISRDETMLASGSRDNTIKLRYCDPQKTRSKYFLKTRKEIKIQETASRTLTGHSHWIRQVLFLPDGRLASCSNDHTVRVWDTASGEELFTLRGHTSEVLSIVMLPNGWLASGSFDKTIKLWHFESRKEVKTLRGHSGLVSLLKVLKSDHLVSYSNDNTMKVWNPMLNENNLLLTIEGHGNAAWFAPLLGVPSNDYLVTCSRDKDDQEVSTLRVWDPKDGRLVKSLLTGLKGVGAVLVLSNDQVAVGTSNGTIKIIDLDDDQKTTRTIEKAHGEWIYSLLQLSNGNLVSSGLDKEVSSAFHSIKVWNLSDLSLLQNVKTDRLDRIRSLSISRDETMLATGNEDSTIKLWPLSSN